ncbi:TonB family protein [bacterium SCSIO 12696]|nr:TonB family protein [bacterium SCSIO 12696]
MNQARHSPLLVSMAISLLIGFTAIPAQAKDLVLNGVSSYRELGNDKFLAALYLSAPGSNYEQIIAAPSKRMEMRLTSSYSKRRWVNLWMQGIAISNSSQRFSNMAEPLVNLFNQQKGGLEPGDVVTISQSDNGSSYQINGVTLASGLPSELFDLFVNTWVGKAPPSSSFRDAILGKGDNLGNMEQQLATITPASGRVTAVEAWIAPPEPEIDEAQLLAEQKAAEEAAARAEALVKAEADAAQKAAEASIPTQVALVNGFMLNDLGYDPHAITLAAAEALQQQAESLAEDAFSVESALALKDYIRTTKKEIHGSLKYPPRALRQGYEGQVRLNIELDRQGNLVKVEAAEKSRHKTLDSAAIRAVKKAAPYEPIPDEISEEVLSLSIPFKFTLVQN